MDHTPEQVQRAFAMADEAMWIQARSHAQVIDGKMYFVGNYPFPKRALATACPELKEAFDWLQDRGYVEIGKDKVGEFIAVLRRPGEGETDESAASGVPAASDPASDELRELHERWPGGLDEIEASLESWRSLARRAAAGDADAVRIINAAGVAAPAVRPSVALDLPKDAPVGAVFTDMQGGFYDEHGEPLEQSPAGVRVDAPTDEELIALWDRTYPEWIVGAPLEYVRAVLRTYGVAPVDGYDDSSAYEERIK